MQRKSNDSLEACTKGSRALHSRPAVLDALHMYNLDISGGGEVRTTSMRDGESCGLRGRGKG